MFPSLRVLAYAEIGWLGYSARAMRDRARLAEGDSA
jgi:hypothetical protein